MTYWGFDRRAHTGELIVNAAVTKKIIKVFSVLYRARYQIHRMALPDAYQGSDPRSTNADNTSAFNRRLVDGTNDWSMHAYGLGGRHQPMRERLHRERLHRSAAVQGERGPVTACAGPDPRGRPGDPRFRSHRLGVGAAAGHAQAYQHFLKQRALERVLWIMGLDLVARSGLTPGRRCPGT